MEDLHMMDGPWTRGAVVEQWLGRKIADIGSGRVDIRQERFLSHSLFACCGGRFNLRMEAIDLDDLLASASICGRSH